MADHMTLPDGRQFDYKISGDPNGFPFFFIHGTPGSRVGAPGVAEACAKKGLKCIDMSRAGYGNSGRKKGRVVVDAAADIAALKDHLGINECFVGGWSGGGPHSLACAARLPGCKAALVVAGVAPYDLFKADGLDWVEGQGEDNIKEFEASLKGEEASQELLMKSREGMLQADAAGLTEEMASLLPEIDRKAIIEHKEVSDNFIETVQEGLRHNADGFVDDNLAFVAPWGFDLNEIKIPVFLYQGSVDLMVPYSHGQWLAKKIPQEHLTAHLLEGQGHISIFLGRVNQMLDELIATRSR